MRSHKVSITEKIIKLFETPKFRYKSVPVNIFGLPVFSAYKKQSVINSISRLQKNGYIRNDSNLFVLLPKGRQYMEKRARRFLIFTSPFDKKASKNLLVMFDIPEERKAERNWLRYQLQEFGYEMIQRSVWVGPSPLPKEFKDYIKNIKLEKCIQTFKLAKPYVTHSVRSHKVS